MRLHKHKVREWWILLSAGWPQTLWIIACFTLATIEFKRSGISYNNYPLDHLQYFDSYLITLIILPTTIREIFICSICICHNYGFISGLQMASKMFFLYLWFYDLKKHFSAPPIFHCVVHLVSPLLLLFNYFEKSQMMWFRTIF